MSSSKRPKTNIELLTEGHKYVQKARKARQEQVEAIKFDDNARSEWLGGFHKRKKAKTDERRARAKERDRIAHRDERRAARDELKKKAAENVRNVRMAMGLDAPNDKQDGESDSDSGYDEVKGPVEDAYEDEDQIATVTIVQDFDPSAPGPSRRSLSPCSSADDKVTPKVLPSQEKEKKRKVVGVLDMPASSRRAQKRAKSSTEKTKSDKKDRGMETKAERKLGRAMEAKKRAKKAGLALERDGRHRGGDRGRGGDKGRRKGGKPQAKGKKRAYRAD